MAIMFRLFKSVLPSVGRVAQSRNAGTISRRSFEDFCRDEHSVEYFRKSQEAFRKAQEYLETKDLFKAKEAINEAIINGGKVESVGPNSFMLTCFNLQKRIMAQMVDGVKVETSWKCRK
jgi:hypothetical protein